MTPAFYLPKLENADEAALWNDVFLFVQEAVDIPRGTFRATVLIETITAAFEMDAILYALREHSSGLNAGRWDYIFSVIKKFREDPAFVLPDRIQVTMTVPFMRAYTELLVQTCHKRHRQWPDVAQRLDLEVRDRLSRHVRHGHSQQEGVDVVAHHDVALEVGGLLRVVRVQVQRVMVHREQAEQMVVVLGDGLSGPVLVHGPDFELLVVPPELHSTPPLVSARPDRQEAEHGVI